MPEKRLLSVSKFAKLSRTSRDTLHHYDKIGLLVPISRRKSGYRYYSIRQLETINLIRILQELGMTLSEIKIAKDMRSPEYTRTIFIKQMEIIDQELDMRLRAKRLLRTMKKTVDSVLGVDEQAITIQYLPAEPIILGDINDYSAGRNDYDALYSFYFAMNDKHFDLNYPVWAVFSQDRIKRGDWVWPDRYYLYSPDGHDERPAAFYAVGYTRGGYGDTDQLYRRMIDYIDQNGFEICGNTYEEYPLNEVYIPDDTNYLIRVLITVCKKSP